MRDVSTQRVAVMVIYIFFIVSVVVALKAHSLAAAFIAGVLADILGRNLLKKVFRK